MRRLIKWLVILGVLFGAFVAAGFVGLQYLKAKSVPRYTTVTVSTGKVETVVNSTGPIKPVQSVSVGSFISGPIQTIHVDFNSTVKKGQVLAQIDTRLSDASLNRESAALATQVAELDRLEALVKQAVRQEQRAINLRKTNIDYVSEQEMDELQFKRIALEAQVKVARANIDVAIAGLDNAITNLEFTKIVSPVDGIVIDRKVDPGQTVASSFQTPELFIIAPDMDKHMYVYASVDEADIGQIRASQEKDRRVTFTVDAYPEDVFTGKIFQVRKSSTTTQNVVTYPVVIEAPNPGMKLMPGMTANISFQIDVRENVTRIPAAALRFVPPDNLLARPEDKEHIDLKAKKKDPKEAEEKLSAERRAEQAKARSKRVVWVQEGDKLRAIPITIGLVDGQYAELVSGDVKPGQVLVTGLEGSNGRENR
jgi:HlyD family secretion protein